MEIIWELGIRNWELGTGNYEPSCKRAQRSVLSKVVASAGNKKTGVLGVGLIFKSSILYHHSNLSYNKCPILFFLVSRYTLQ
jgi:hypothetical protein